MKTFFIILFNLPFSPTKKLAKNHIRRQKTFIAEYFNRKLYIIIYSKS